MYVYTMNGYNKKKSFPKLLYPLKRFSETLCIADVPVPYFITTETRNLLFSYRFYLKSKLQRLTSCRINPT